MHGRSRMTVDPGIPTMPVKFSPTRQASRPPSAGGGGGGALSSAVACLGHLTIDHAFLARRSTVPTPNRDTCNSWAITMCLPNNT